MDLKILFYIFILCIGYSNGNSNHLIFPLEDVPIQFKSVTCPDGQSSCPDSETCCLLSSGQYGCCPLPNAVCCSDNLHCCPNGYTCDVEHSRCQKGFEQSHDVLCPGGEMSCNDGETCCQLQSGDYGCCPLPDAVCCSDYSHCCPHGYKCNIEENKCEKGISIPWFTKTPAFKNSKSDITSKLILPSSSSAFTTIQCPDGKSFCPEETTCCQLLDDSYGCCPYIKATCCSDKVHCCGEGYSCDSSGSRCIKHLNIINQTEIKIHQLIRLFIINEQICPDKITKCSLTSTCCPNKNNDEITYSCCPYSQGVCCGSNGSYCCPHKYICDESHLTCQLNKTNSFEINKIFNKCGLSDFACSSDQTCCKISQLDNDEENQYACCHFPQGVCCNDGRHCCPKNTKCDLKSGGCIQQ